MFNLMDICIAYYHVLYLLEESSSTRESVFSTTPEALFLDYTKHVIFCLVSPFIVVAQNHFNCWSYL